MAFYVCDEHIPSGEVRRPVVTLLWSALAAATAQFGGRSNCIGDGRSSRNFGI
jgi:hypothetical protein